jgi:hypothetical protein
MIPYWALFGLFAFAALVGGARLRLADRAAVVDGRGEPHSLLLIIGAAIVALMIGFRYRVGGDWGAYDFMYKLAFYHSFGELLTWVSQQMDGGLLFIDIVCGVIFSWGLYRLVRIQPEPWLAMLVAVPYMIIVVAMGYSRQGVALGILMAGLAKLMRGGSALSFVPYVAAAALFHKTAIVVLPLGIIGVYSQRVIPILFAVGFGYLIYSFLLQGSLGELIQSYVGARYSSQGAITRVLMTTSAAALFYIFRTRLNFNQVEERIWRNFSLASFAMMAALFIVPSSTVIDRLALYLLPLQVAVIGRIPLVTDEEFFGRAVVIAFSGAVLFVWLMYADNSSYWIPYQFYPS